MDALSSPPAAETESQTARKPPPPPAALGIASQIRFHLDGHRPSGDAFVVSVYGEWGIGKTFCLKSIRDLFDADLTKDINTLIGHQKLKQLTIPVFFDPWRFEHEEHLVVPLLKTIEYALRKVEARIDHVAEASQTAGEMTISVLRQAADKIGRGVAVLSNVAAALAAGFKLKVAPLGIGAEYSVKDVIDVAVALDAANQALPETPVEISDSAAGRFSASVSKLAESAKKYESLYFDTGIALGEFTQDKDLPLRLVVLIDDLDRCLPEKAVQVLESVKLFLNVPGFSFVLAVDDEVVERGIAHRYRDYRPAEAEARAAAPLFSGAEYLEKIVHLPVHLQRWAKEEAKQFLRESYPDLFGSALPTLDPGKETDRRKETSRSAPEAEQLLDLVTGAIPLVPRKLIRLAEGLAFYSQQFAQLGEQRRLSLLHAAQIVALQQLYPALYRRLRLRESRFWRLFEITLDSWGDPTYGGESQHDLEVKLSKPDRSVPDAGAAPTSEQAETIQEKYELLTLIKRATELRGAPNPLLLFKPPAGVTDDQWRKPELVLSGVDNPMAAFFRLYFLGLSLPQVPAKPGAPADSNLTVATIANPERFLAALLNPDAIARQEFLESSGAFGGRLPDDVFETLNNRLKSEAHLARAEDIAWLRDVTKITSPEQLLALYQQHDVLNRLLNAGMQPAPSTSSGAS